MHRKSAITLLESYFSEDLLEQENKKKMMDFILSEENCFERSCKYGHFTSSCWIESFDGNSILLTHHKKFNDWLQLGGHADGDNDLLRVSLKEGFEESGIELEPISNEIFDIGVHFIPEYKDVGPHYHFDVRFYLKAINNDNFIISDESNDLKWVSKEFDLPDNSEIKRMFKKWKNLKKHLG